MGSVAPEAGFDTSAGVGAGAGFDAVVIAIGAGGDPRAPDAEIAAQVVSTAAQNTSAATSTRASRQNGDT